MKALVYHGHEGVGIHCTSVELRLERLWSQKKRLGNLFLQIKK